MKKKPPRRATFLFPCRGWLANGPRSAFPAVGDPAGNLDLTWRLPLGRGELATEDNLAFFHGILGGKLRPEVAPPFRDMRVGHLVGEGMVPRFLEQDRRHVGIIKAFLNRLVVAVRRRSDMLPVHYIGHISLAVSRPIFLTIETAQRVFTAKAFVAVESLLASRGQSPKSNGAFEAFGGDHIGNPFEDETVVGEVSRAKVSGGGAADLHGVPVHVRSIGHVNCFGGHLISPLVKCLSVGEMCDARAEERNHRAINIFENVVGFQGIVAEGHRPKGRELFGVEVVGVGSNIDVGQLF